MKLIITDKDCLLKPLQMVSGIVDRRHTLPILSNVLIEIENGKLTLVTSDLEIEVETVTSNPDFENNKTLKTSVSVRKFLEILRALPANTNLELTKLQNRLQIVSGKSRFNLQLLSAEDFPRMVSDEEPSGITFTLTQKILKNQLLRTAPAMAQKDLRYYLNGLLFSVEEDKLTIVATDMHRLGLTSIHLDDNFEKTETIVPRKTVLELIKQLEDSDEPVTIEILPKKICFHFSEAVLTSKVIAGNFINFKRAIPEACPFEFTINRLDFLHALQRIAIILNTNELLQNVRLNISNGKMNISAHNKDQEDAQEEIEIDYSNETIDSTFNISYLMEVLNTLNSKTIKCSFKKIDGGILITLPDDQQFMHILMPMLE
jgi:DNA polymerase-3 subunit beta